MEPNTPPRTCTLLSVADAAARMAVSTKTIRREIARGALNVLRLGPSGRTIRIPEAELERYARTRLTGPLLSSQGTDNL